MGKYHNKLDKKYFNKSIYMKKFVETFNIKLKDNPLQYELVYETYNTFIIINNTLFSLNYIPIDKKVNNMIDISSDYLDTYKNKIKKCYDSQCILLYESFENMLDDIDLVWNYYYLGTVKTLQEVYFETEQTTKYVKA